MNVPGVYVSEDSLNALQITAAYVLKLKKKAADILRFQSQLNKQLGVFQNEFRKRFAGS